MKRARALALALCLALPGAAARAAAPLDARDLGAFFDGLMRGLMTERHVPGAVVLVAHDGAVVFSRGYGVADLETRRPVDPDTTLFRVASVSKLFTATAVMQLVEEGRLDLDADVNRYLEGFAVPATFPEPITLRHLLTHTPGFDDSFLHGSERLGEPMLSLRAYLERFLPRRVRAPGELLSYSNHGVALAGLVVEEAAGRPLREVFRERIFGPLGMTQSGFSLPSAPPPELATGYEWKGGRYVPVALDRMRWYPGGDLHTSAGEIARFLLAHLDGCRIPGGGRLLREESVRAMHTRAFSQHPELSGWGLGFDERRFGDARAVGHGGSWNGYGTELVLLPEARLGLFVSTTRANDDRFFRPLLRAFFERYVPEAAPQPPLEPGRDARAHAAEAAGVYLPNRHVRGDFLKLGLLMSALRVEANADGSITLRVSDGSRDPIRAVESRTGVWHADDGQARIALLRGERGSIAHLAVDAWVFDRVPWWRDPRLHQIAFAVCALAFAGTLLGFAVGAVARRVSSQPASPLPLRVRALASAASACGLGAILAIAFGLLTVSPFELFVAVPAWLRGAGLAAVVAIPAAPWLLFESARAATPLARLHLAVLAAASAVFAALAAFYHLIGWIG